jgi:penicillin amidase
MVKKIIRVIVGVVLVLGIFVGLGAAFGPSYIKNTAKKSFPTVEGELQVSGLNAPVQIYRDSFGVPHIYGSSHHDLFFAQGYVHAQDRFWQMDFWRHLGAGRLSELVGGAMLDTDKFLRTLGWERVAKQELELLGPEERAILDAYTAGVNAYLSEHSGTALSLEYLFLPIVNSGYEPAEWTPINSLTWEKAMAWDLRGNLDSEIDRAKLLKVLSPSQLNDLYPPYPEDHPLIVPGFSLSEAGTSALPAQETDGESPAGLQSVMADLEKLQYAAHQLDQLSGGGFTGLGSNSWAISGKLTDTGKPYLANDPHLASQMPSIWYEVGLHCIEKNKECQLNVEGFSFAGAPGVIIGHNDRIAWGMTNVGPDVMDLYIEKLNPDDPTLYLTPEGWKEMDTVTEVIEVAGKKPVEQTVYLTEHGPLIGSVYGLENFQQETGLGLPEQYALALKWTALEPSCVFCAVWDFNLAGNWEEFRNAARDFQVPSQNLLYADVDGNIGYQTPGLIPIRAEGHDGMLPVPGWTGEYEWQGYIPFEDLPFAFNPAEGYIVTANNAVVGASYPYSITRQWNQGFRAQRIVDLLETGPRPLTLEYIKTIQGDNYDLIAETLVPIILDLEGDSQELHNAQQLLVNWDYMADMDSGTAALFMTFWQNLVTNALQDDLPDDFQVGVDSNTMEIFRQLAKDKDNIWWDDRNTPQREDMLDIFRLTLEESYRQLVKEQGKDPGGWNWGSLHTITFQNQVMSSFPLVNQAFNRGPYSTAGGNDIVNAVGWDYSAPFEVDWLPSMRMIVDLSDLSRSVTIHTTGQSGHAYHPHYIDMVDLWRKIRYHPMLWTEKQVQNQAESLLILNP